MFAYKLLRVCVVLALGLVAAGPALAESKFSFATTPGQLPKTVIPSHYAITLTPDMQSLTFKGSEVIDLDVKTASNTITLNALELDVASAGLDGQVAQVKTDEAKQTLTLTFPAPVKPGPHKLAIEFAGKIGNQAQGLYYDRYQTAQGQKVLLATQMEPTDARRMFPGWDEPVYRTTYQLTVNVPEKFMAVSNMPVESEKVGKDLKTVTFQRTPKMSSYLMVLVTGELEAIEAESAGVKLRVITTEGKKESGRYALESLQKLLPYYDDYFGVKYPLPKLDMIALPGGFSGAMENWGGITYNESILLFDPKTSSQGTKEAIFNVVAHEVAHQWFGDLVTMAWWDNLWLNEGFATWMAFKATDQFNPDWNVWLRANASKNEAMASDARKTTHPVQQPVKDPSEAAAAFDEITYEKGGAVIRMLETYLGEADFKAGMRRYMAAHQYSSTTTADLWESLQQASSKPVAAIATSWTEQPGLPVVKVSAACQSTRELALTQERFTINDPSPAPLMWQIPVSVQKVGAADPVDYTLLTTKTASVREDGCQGAVKLNAGNTGYYRVQYEPVLFKALQTNAEKLPEADRVNLLSDTWAMVQAGRLPSTNYLELVQAVRNDTSLAVWEQVLGTLESIDALQVGQPGRSAFQAYGRSLLGPVFSRIGWDAKPGEAQTVALLRSKLLTSLGNFRDEAVIDEARQRFRTFLQTPGSLTPDLRPPVFHIVGRYSDQATYDQLQALGRKTQSTEEKRLFYRAMAAALDPKLARRTLDVSLTEEVNPTLATRLVPAVAEDGEHRLLAWEFAQKHMKELLDKQTFFRKNRYVPGLLGVFSDVERATELEAYAKANLPPEAQTEVAKSAENIRFNSSLRQRELARINSWVCNQSGSPGGFKAQYCIGNS